MYKLPFRLADEDEQGQQPLQALPANHFLSSVPTSLNIDDRFSLARQNASWDSAYLGGSLASADFDIDVTTGFLPAEPPIVRLDGQWELWEQAWEATNTKPVTLGTSPQGEAWRSAVRNLPVVSTAGLATLPQLRRAHLVLAFIAHRYIHATSSGDTTLPEPIARPWLEVSERLDMPTVLTYADTVLYNWGLIDPAQGIHPENIKILTTFTGTKSEEHFYLISLLIELHGASALRLMATSLDELFVNDALAHQRISENLAQLSDILDDLSEIFGNMRTDCAPEVFYGLIRHWFNGGAWTLDLGPQQESHRQDYGGPSAGQSTLIHALDVFLGVDHRPKGASPAADSTAFDDTFMQRMSTYMPHHHRLFLRHLSSQTPTLRSTVLSAVQKQASGTGRSSAEAEADANLREAYDASIDALTRLRQVHTKIVYTYIIAQSLKAQGKPVPGADSDSTSDSKEESLKGTGGTNLVSFLRSTRQRTIEARSRVASRGA